MIIYILNKASLLEDYFMNTRKNWIDIAKGLGLIFVLIGHTKLYILATIVYIFHMPMFFYLSGYVFSYDKYDFKTFVLKKVKSLLIPYYVLGFFVLIANTITNMYLVDFRLHYLMRITDEQEKIINYFTQERFGTLWYISALFWMSIILACLMKLCKGNHILISLIISFLAIATYVYYALGGGSVYCNLDATLAMLPFYYIGYISSRLDLFNKRIFINHPVGCLFTSIAICLVAGGTNLLYMGEKIDIFYNKYGIIPVMYIGAISGTIAVIILSHKINSRFLTYIGQNSMLIYALHQATIFTIGEIVMYKHNKLWENIASYRILEGIVCIVLSIVIFGALTILIKKSRISMLFGLTRMRDGIQNEYPVHDC